MDDIVYISGYLRDILNRSSISQELAICLDNSLFFILLQMRSTCAEDQNDLRLLLTWSFEIIVESNQP